MTSTRRTFAEAPRVDDAGRGSVAALAPHADLRADSDRRPTRRTPALSWRLRH